MKTTWVGWPARGRGTRQTDLEDLLEPAPSGDDVAAVAESEGDACQCDECQAERMQRRLLALYRLGDLGDTQIALPSCRETLYGVLPADSNDERRAVEAALAKHWRLTDSGYVPGTMDRDDERARI